MFLNLSGTLSHWHEDWVRHCVKSSAIQCGLMISAHPVTTGPWMQHMQLGVFYNGPTHIFLIFSYQSIQWLGLKVMNRSMNGCVDPYSIPRIYKLMWAWLLDKGLSGLGCPISQTVSLISFPRFNWQCVGYECYCMPHVCARHSISSVKSES